jgi:hypothetical protein
MILTQVRMCEALARHFKVSKASVVNEVKAYFESIETKENPIIEITIKEQSMILGASQDAPKMDKLWRYKKFITTSLYSHVEDCIGNLGAEAVCFYTAGALLAVSIDCDYSGMGGLLIKENVHSGKGYVIELFENYLMRTAPVLVEE